FIQGRNNRFFGLLVGADRSPAKRDAYVGLQFRHPSRGDNAGHQVYGLVAEGFGCGVYVESADVNAVRVSGYDSSLNSHAFWNGSYDGDTPSERRNNVHIELAGAVTGYDTSPAAAAEPLTLPDGAEQPSVAGSAAFACHNTRRTSINDFRDGRP